MIESFRHFGLKPLYEGRKARSGSVRFSVAIDNDLCQARERADEIAVEEFAAA